MPNDSIPIKKVTPDPITQYWLKYYAGTTWTDCCTLCGNHGWLDTRGTKSPAGVESGAVNYCICPNGQILRKKKITIPY